MTVIKDFEMPKSCYDCDLNNYHFCDITGNLIESNRDDGTRADDCPLIEIKENNWIPVSEKLPENKETVLVTFKHFVSGKTIGLGSVILLRGKPHWHVREQNLGTYEVLAWMPLPEPYKENKDE